MLLRFYLLFSLGQGVGLWEWLDLPSLRKGVLFFFNIVGVRVTVSTAWAVMIRGRNYEHENTFVRVGWS